MEASKQVFIEVVNIKTLPKTKLTEIQKKMLVPIFRGKSCLGNPFSVYTYGRDDCINRFENWFKSNLKHHPNMVTNEFYRLVELAKESTEENPLRLMCFCNPLNCHGDVIKRFILEELK